MKHNGFFLVSWYIILHTTWCRVLLEKLTGLQLVKKFPAFHGTRRFINAFTSVRHMSLSWASPIQSIYPHPTSWRSILILSTHLGLGLPSGLLPSGFPTKTAYTPPHLTNARHMPSPSHSIYVCMYVCRFQNVYLRCPTPRLHCFLSSHWSSFRFLSFMAFLIPSIQLLFLYGKTGYANAPQCYVILHCLSRLCCVCF